VSVELNRSLLLECFYLIMLVIVRCENHDTCCIPATVAGLLVAWSLSGLTLIVGRPSS